MPVYYFLNDLLGITKVLTMDIVCLQVDGDYVFFYMADSERYVDCGSLISHVEELGEAFYAISRECAVNMHHVKRLLNSGTVKLLKGPDLTVSRRRLPAFKHALQRVEAPANS